MNRIFHELQNLKSLMFFKSTKNCCRQKDNWFHVTVYFGNILWNIFTSYFLSDWLIFWTTLHQKIIFVKINRVRDRLAFLITKRGKLVFVVFVCKKISSNSNASNSSILASFSQEMKSSSKQWVQISVVVKKQKYLVKWIEVKSWSCKRHIKPHFSHPGLKKEANET